MRAIASIFLVVPLALCLPCPAQEQQNRFCPSGLVSVDNDRFSGNTSIISVHKPGPLGRLVPHLGAEFKSKNMVVAQLVLSGGYMGDWRYLKCHTTYILADGKQVPTSRATHDGDVINGGVVENIMVTLDLKAIAQLEQAKNIEFKVCDDEFQADWDFVCAAREFACKVREQRAGNTRLSACDPLRRPPPAGLSQAESSAWAACIEKVKGATDFIARFPSYDKQYLVSSDKGHFEFRSYFETVGLHRGPPHAWTCSVEYENGVAREPQVTIAPP